MKLKTRERYSLRMMISIAQLSKEHQPVGLRKVSAHSGISRSYLEQLVMPLKQASLLEGLAGRDGGYVLAKQPSKIRLGEIIAAAAGEIAVTDCAVGIGTCAKSGSCKGKDLWTLINHRIKETLNEHSLADLLSNDWHNTVEEQLAILR